MTAYQRVFISSTCYDLIDVRAELAAMLRSAGLEPVLSDMPESEFEVQTGEHSIQTCLVNIERSDVVIVVLSTRYGPVLRAYGHQISATHLEYRRAVELKKPVFFFVRNSLYAAYGIFKSNPEEAKYPGASEKDIVALCGFIAEHEAHREGEGKNNWISPFANSTDLKNDVRKQLKASIAASEAQRLMGPKIAAQIVDALTLHRRSRSGGPSESNYPHVLGLLAQCFRGRANDLSAVWLRPDKKSPDKLSVRASCGSKIPDHYQFGKGEGLAGNVWKTNTPAQHSADLPHADWAYREGCLNATYLCAPVGDTEDGGVVAVGSNEGFPLGESDLSLVKIFAAILALTLPDARVLRSAKNAS